MADMLGNALSALVSYQRALATTSHNIANADTEGYSRQRVDFATRIPQQMGDLSIGSGVKLSDVRRVYDEFANLQMRNASGSFSQLDNFYQLATQLDNSLSDPELGISAALSRFYDSVQNLADDPASIPSRQLLLSEAESLGGRFAEFSAQLEGLSKEVNARIQSDVNDINDLAQELADINGLVVEAQGKFGAAPNDLLDQRDLALQRLNDLVSIKTVEQDDGATNVFIGNGQSLVLGEESRSMTTTRSPFGSDRLELAMASSPQSPISEVLSGGSLGASLSFRDGLLDTTKNELGRIATALTTSLNQQNGQGLDLDGNLGADIFNTLSPSAIAATGNASGAQLSATIEDISALDGRNLLVQFDGAAWSFRNAANGQQISAWSGSGTAADPFLIDGVSLTLDAPAAAGDRFLVTPTADAAAQVSVIMSNPAQLAAAAPTRSGADGANTGAAQITETRIVDASDPNLSASVAIEFLDANTYQINGSGSFSYSPGAEIVVNGNAVAITGSPIAGDRFYIEANSGASGDNRNMLAMAAVENSKLLDGGASSVQNAVSGLVGDIAVATRSAELNRDSQENLLRQTRENVEAISGVNLDEEAANLLKYQQAYQAAAQATSIANQLFQSLISSFRQWGSRVRISTAQIYAGGLSAMLEQQSKLLDTQTQLATGEKRLSPADDPVGAVRSLELSRSLDRSEQFQRNAVILDNRLRMEESTLAESVEIMQRVRTLALQANNASQDNESRQAIARELEQQVDSLLALANTRDSDGRYIFSGYQQDTQAFSRDVNGFRYNGDDGQRLLQVGANRQLADTSPGSELFTGIANGNGRFQAIAGASNTGQAVIDAGAVSDQQLYNGDAIDIVFIAPDQYELRDSSAAVIATASYRSGDSIDVAGMTVSIQGEPAAGDSFSLRASEAEDVFSMVADLARTLAEPRSGSASRALQTSSINGALANIDQALDHLIAKQADSGARMQALDRQREVNESVNLQVQQNLSVINDLDYAEAVSRFEQQRLGLQAAQQAFAKVQGLSLFNYL